MAVHQFPKAMTMLTLTAGLMLLASAAVAQDDAGAGGDEATVFMPESVMGQPFEAVVTPGPALLETMDPDDPQHVQQLEDLNGMLADVGATLERLHVASGQALSEEDHVVVIAIRVEGADLVAGMEPWMDFLTAGTYDVPEATEGEIGGKTVQVIVEGDYPFDDPPKSFMYAAGDTVWFVGGTEEWAVEAIETLPA
jgi:hypothetical protein